MSSWADRAIEVLRSGETVTITPTGNSMRPRIKSGAEVVLEPLVEGAVIERGEIVLARVRGNVYLHYVSALEPERVQISNASGHVNGWTARRNVYGRAISIDNSKAR